MSSARMPAISGKEDLKSYVWQAYAHGKTLDLGAAVYGPATGSNRGYIDETMPYYQLLAGHLALSSAATVMEVGTHFGGSTLALLAGMRDGGAESPRIVTMDVTDLNRERLAREPEIVKVIGDSTEPGFVEGLAANLPSREIDVLYIDALKDASFVLTTMHNAHLAGLAPKWLILDDVETDGLKPMWDLLEAAEPEFTLLVSKEYPEIRDRKQGFGFISLQGGSDLLGRAAEFMAALGLDAGTLAQGLDGDRFASLAADTGSTAYADDVDDRPTTGASVEELETLYLLARDYYAGDGEIVDVGNPAGATTRALAEGLTRNDAVGNTLRRIHAFDTFRVDNPVTARLFDGQAADGDSVLPQFFDTVGSHGDTLNVYELPLNLVRWFGKPVEILVAGSIRSPQVSAQLIAEFVPRMMAGKSVLVHQEALSRFRPWTAHHLAYLAEHLVLLSVRRDSATYGYVKPIPQEKLNRLLENRFEPEERLALVRDYAASCENADHAWAFLLQAAWIALGNKEPETALDIFDEVLAMPAPKRQNSAARLGSLRAALVKAGLLDDGLAVASGKEQQ